MSTTPGYGSSAFGTPFRNAIIMNQADVGKNSFKLFITTPFLSPLVLENEGSDARDHCANERTFLSWVRLSMYLNVVAAAIWINFHFKTKPTVMEMHMSRPLAIIFWTLAFIAIINGFANYVKTVARYARRRAMSQYGRKTQMVFILVSLTIIASCGAFIASDSQRRERNMSN